MNTRNARSLILPARSRNQCLAVLSCLALLAVLSIGLSAKPRETIKLLARFTGTVRLEGDLMTDDAVDIVARGPGEVKQLGPLSSAELRWTVRREVVLGLLAGSLKEAPLNAGTLVAETPDGATVLGVFRAVVRREGRSGFGVFGEFEITGGTGRLEGINGQGPFDGKLDLRSREYRGVIHGELDLP